VTAERTTASGYEVELIEGVWFCAIVNSSFCELYLCQDAKPNRDVALFADHSKQDVKGKALAALQGMQTALASLETLIQEKA
jgi:hypothetical protein